MVIKHRVQLVDLMDELKLSSLSTAEIGVAEGYFSCEIMQKTKTNHYLIDNWGTIHNVTGDGNSEQEWHDKNYEDAKKRNEKFGDRAIFLKGLSIDMAMLVPDNSLGLVYLDGAHYYSGVKSDLNVWFPKLVEGGIMAGHDYLNPAYGVKDAVHEFCEGKFTVHTIEENNVDDAGFYFIKKTI